MIINGQYSIIAANNAISDIFVGKTSGLLGYWDENVDKEYLLPNKVFLNTASTMYEIHHNFGQRCKFSITG